MMRMNKIVWAGLLWLSGISVQGQNTEAGQEIHSRSAWTLKQCIDYAIEHNINVRQKALDKENQEVYLHSTRFSRLPDLNAGVGQDFYFGRGPGRDGTYKDQTQSTSSLNVRTNLNLFSGFKINNQVKMRELNLQAAVEELNKAKEDLSLNITSYFLQVLFNKELCQIAEEQVALNREQVSRTEVLVKEGKNPESELFDARAALAKEEVNLTQAKNDLKLSLLDLGQLLNLESVENFDVAMPDVNRIVIAEIANLSTPVEVYTQSVELRPMIKAAEFRLQSSEKNLKVVKADLYPQLSLGASYNNSYYHTYNLEEGASNTSFATQIRHNGSESVGLSLSIPIFNRWAVRDQVRSAQIAIESEQLSLKDARQNLYKEIQQAYYNAVAAHEKYLSSVKAVAASQMAFNYEEEKYNAGRSTSYQFNDAKTRLGRSMSEAAQAKYEFIFRSKILDFYNGQSLY